MKEAARSAPPAAHPLAGQTLSGAQMLVQVLADEGVDVVFGYSGGAILPAVDAVYTLNEARQRIGGQPVPPVRPANAQGAAFLGAGHPRAAGRRGGRHVTSGPGATNTVTPVRDCMADSVPIVVICGQVSTAAIGTDAFQEAPVAAIMGSVAKHVFLDTDPARLEDTVRTAFEIARTGRPGPVVIDLPKDVQNWQGTFRGVGRLAIPGYRQHLAEVAAATLGEDAAAAFFGLLAESQRPLIYAGGGVINGNASAALTELVELLQVPVVTTLMGLGAYDTTRPLSMRMLGMHGHAFANYAVEDCDLLIAVGARFDDRVAGDPKKFARRARRVAHLDIDRAEVNKVKNAHWYHVGELAPALGALAAWARHTGFQRDFAPWLAALAANRQRYAMNYDRASTLVQPPYVIEEINRHTGG